MGYRARRLVRVSLLHSMPTSTRAITPTLRRRCSTRAPSRDVEVALRDPAAPSADAGAIKALELQVEPCALSIVHDIGGQRRAEMQEREQRMQLTI